MTKKIMLLGTGGTIAGVAATAGDGVGYQAAQLGVRELLAALPLAGTAPPIEAEQVGQIDSKNMDWTLWRALALRCKALLDDASVGAIVITHGTDTLEETAWWLHCCLAAHKPVVLTCAMRPATALLSDGPQNLCDALALATNRGLQGVWVVAAGAVHSPQAVQKIHPYRLDAFSSGDAGPCAWVEEGRVRWAQNRPPGLIKQARIAIENIANTLEAPWVEIVMSHACANGWGVDALVAAGVRGLVVAATGNGTVHQHLELALRRAQAAGVPVRLSTRCLYGPLVGPQGWAGEPGLSPVKARVSLMLELIGAR